MTFESRNEPFKFCEMIQNNQGNDVVDKFRAYRLSAEANAAKLKEANSMIDHLKTEIHISKKVETNLKSQILSAENRLIHLHKTNMKILKISECFRQSEETCQEIEKKISEIKEEIQKIKEQSQNVIGIVSKEIILMKKCEELKLNLKNKENEVNVIKEENQILAKQKEEIQMQAEQKFEILRNNSEEMERQIMEIRSDYYQNLEAYKKKIEQQELALKQCEREKKSLLEDFAMPEMSEINYDVAFTNNTDVFLDNRLPKSSKLGKRSMDSECNGRREAFSMSATSRGNANYKNPKQVNSKLKKSHKEKPQLEFLMSDLSQTNSSDAPPPKRKLFSLNCNDYIN